MGTHPNGPASLFHTPSTSLLNVMKSDPTHFLGNTLLNKWPSTIHIPFLFKILSVGKALPLQAHPDKSLGEKLNRENPSEFVDANHKPEIAVSIGQPLEGDWGEDVAFIGFVGFRPLNEIKDFVANVKELRQAVGDERLVNDFLENPSKPTLKNLFSTLIIRGANHPDAIRKEIEGLVSGLSDGTEIPLGSSPDSKEAVKLLIKVNNQYPGDVGVFSTTFFMNLARLKAGESIYIGADEIHAYLEGDIIECMSISDNVLNAAFVPQSQATSDAPTFLSMLTYTSRQANYWSLHHEIYSKSKTGRTQVYAPPLEEFVVLGTALSRSSSTETLGPVDGPTIAIVTKGQIVFRVTGSNEKVEVGEGGIVYIVPGSERLVELLSGNSGEVWWATNSV